MDKDVISIIKNQTEVQDEVYIERIYYECKSDLVSTIMKLSNIKPPEVEVKPKTVFDDIRKIVDEKENIYHNRNKGI